MFSCCTEGLHQSTNSVSSEFITKLWIKKADDRVEKHISLLCIFQLGHYMLLNFNHIKKDRTLDLMPGVGNRMDIGKQVEVEV